VSDGQIVNMADGWHHAVYTTVYRILMMDCQLFIPSFLKKQLFLIIFAAKM